MPAGANLPFALSGLFINFYRSAFLHDSLTGDVFFKFNFYYSA